MRKKIVYPYTIKTVQIPEGSESHCTPAARRDWLRIECLLRSATVRKLYEDRPKEVWPMYETETTKTGQAYRKTPCPRPTMRLEGDELEAQYGIPYGWRVLDGAHHELLKGSTPEAAAVVDLQALAKQKPPTVQFEEYLLLGNPRYLCLRFNVTAPFRDLQADLKRRYDQRQADLPKKERMLNVELKTWVQYFRWYDLHTINGLSAGQIRQKEHDRSPRITKSAIEQGLRKTRRMIQRAEQKKWPPPAKFLH